MDVRVKFLGGARTVTGSKFLLEVDKFQLMIDCGLFQGLKEYRLRNWEWLPIDFFKVDAIVLTHAHLDHSGYLPRLFRSGYQGEVYCSEGTDALLDIMLKDSANLQMEEAAWAKKKGYSRHTFPRPLYDLDDVAETLPHLNPVPFGQTISLADHIQIEFLPAGHILGAASVRITIQGDEQEKVLVFSGDIGRYDQPVMPDPTPIPKADVLFVESTYGNRLHPETPVDEDLAKVINRALGRGGSLLIPSFAVGRTQDLLYQLYHLFEKNAIDRVPVYIDSPMAISVTELYRRYDHLHRLNVAEGAEEVFNHPQFRYIRSQSDSTLLNDEKRSSIIISASGMCTGGRILHHLYHRLRREQDTVLFVGYQGEGTRGRDLVEGAMQVKIFGEQVPVRCTVERLDGLSAHADRNELMRWLRNLTESPKATFVVHGEEENAKVFAQRIEEELGWNNVVVPNYLESVHLFQGI